MQILRLNCMGLVLDKKEKATFSRTIQTNKHPNKSEEPRFKNIFDLKS